MLYVLNRIIIIHRTNVITFNIPSTNQPILGWSNDVGNYGMIYLRAGGLFF